MSTLWMAPLGGLPGVGVVVLAVSLGVLGLISYCRAGAAHELPAQRDLLEFCAGQLSVTDGPAQVRPIIDALDALGQADPTARQAVLDIVCGYLRLAGPVPGRHGAGRHGGTGGPHVGAGVPAPPPRSAARRRRALAAPAPESQRSQRAGP